MVNFTTLFQGGTGSIPGIGDATTVRSVKLVVDVARILQLSPTFATGDIMKLFTIPAGAYFIGMDAAIVTALSLGTSPAISIGTTSSAPTEYMSAQTDIAVGRFTTMQAACVVPLVKTAAESVYIKITGGTIASGQIAISYWYLEPASQDFAIAAPKVYTNR